MRVASFQPSFASGSAPARQRMASLALVVLLHLGFLLLLLRIAQQPVPPEKTSAITTVDLVAEPSATPDASEAPSPRAQEARKAEEEEPLPLPPAETPAEPASSIWSQVIPMTRDQLASADRAIRSSPPSARPGETDGESRIASRGTTDDSDGPGSGPNGETLYNARWQREPTDAELSTYLPPGRRRSGWGIIACRTIPGYRVEDCHEISQSPGSGLAGAIRRAAWQFRIHPPRIGGRPMIGEWVRIRIDYTVSDAPNGRPSGG